jgi:tetratricopeptide (TPR) repeat protein
MKQYWILLSFLSFSLFSCAEKEVNLVTGDNVSPEITFGTGKLKTALEKEGYSVNLSGAISPDKKKLHILVEQDASQTLQKEGYTVISEGNTIRIKGNDASGALYGCIDLIKKIETGHRLPLGLNYSDYPEMVLRGTCIGVQKPVYLPGRRVYEYPYTPETFPWFYDKELWIEYLDMLVANKMNSLYLWNGHPFASLVKLVDYPYAVEVDDETFKKNEEMFGFLTEEAKKRGIWVIQMFYNIIVSKPFAEHHGIKTQDRSRPIDPLISDYTRKSIAAFIEKYPNVGLLVCLGEAINTYEDDVKWFTETVIPGVKDGLSALGATEEPPIVLRAHDTNCKMVMDAALPIYKNLYTMHKYNGESLTTYQPGGPWGQIHKDLSALGSIHISNVHILANLEPFRYGSPDFIQKSVQAMHNIHGANALHLYPQASYWDWPYTADKSEPRLKEMERNWIWYEAWARYAWNVNRDRNEEINYWSKKLGDLYGCGKQGRNILEAYEQAGEISPKLLRKFGITEGNRQTFLLGMFMSQLVNPSKWRVYQGFHSSCGPEGEVLAEYIKKEWNKEPHTGEIPPQLIAEVVAHGNAAVEAIEKVAPKVTKNTEEFNRLKNDMYCYQAFAACFAEKVKAAALVLQYAYTDDIALLEEALPHLEKSLDYYRGLVKLTDDTYLYANSMQTGQRRIPVGGDDGKNKTWKELLPQYEEELMHFKKNLAFLQQFGNSGAQTPAILQAVDVKLADKSIKSYPLKKGEKVFADKEFVFGDFAAELKALKPLRPVMDNQVKEGTVITFENSRPVSVLVGYLNSERKEFAKAPTLETDANANQYGQCDVKIANALEVHGRASVNIHSYTFPAGKNTLNLGKGALIVLGFIDAEQTIVPRNASIGVSDVSAKADWLFY